eukprot:CAMPEP_0171370364 /NCGR_PEP_ID=MMETSP0879-20121228/7981_1 /TAXON_ID=67004 /ORGANISM="Thalassiosira weissflogii, Strain CCMP1336" /LENGTH=695 /DNA_ID=CAMNT_0011878835 /DNA_START=756 /DNA_END=2843 /DNA_ORIENTATION=+
MEKRPLYSRSGKSPQDGVATPLSPLAFTVSRQQQQKQHGLGTIANNFEASNHENDDNQDSDNEATENGFGIRMMNHGNNINNNDSNFSPSSSVDELLEKAKNFSMFAVRHIEQARMELLETADSRFLSRTNINNNNKMNGGDGNADNPSSQDDETNNFGGVHRIELAAAFDDLTKAYEKLSLLKWDAVRKEYEAMCRVTLLSEGISKSAPSVNSGRSVIIQGKKNRGSDINAVNTKDRGRATMNERQSVKKQVPVPQDLLPTREIVGNPWYHTTGVATPSWINAGFFHDPFSSTQAAGTASAIAAARNDEKSMEFPSLGNNLGMNWGGTTPPPGFGAHVTNNTNIDNNNDNNINNINNIINKYSYNGDGQGDDNLILGELDNSGHPSNSSDGKDNTQSTSIPSEISSLHTSSHNQSDGSSSSNDNDDDDDDDDESDSESVSSSSASLSSYKPPSPPVQSFDYVYTGGYATKVSNVKEIIGVVPRTVKHVLIDSSVTNIEDGAFHGCNSLESVTISPSVESIGDNAFRKCSALHTVVFLTFPKKKSREKCESGNKKSRQRRRQRKGAAGIVGEEKKTEKLQDTRRHSSRGSYSGNGTSSSSKSESRSSSKLFVIGEWAFFNCSSLTELHLPHGLESIGTRAFQRCSALSIMEVPRSLRYVGESAFYGCPRETKEVFERWEMEKVASRDRVRPFDLS